jgi:hypothetical protein
MCTKRGWDEIEPCRPDLDKGPGKSEVWENARASRQQKWEQWIARFPAGQQFLRIWDDGTLDSDRRILLALQVVVPEKIPGLLTLLGACCPNHAIKYQHYDPGEYIYRQFRTPPTLREGSSRAYESIKASARREHEEKLQRQIWLGPHEILGYQHYLETVQSRQIKNELHSLGPMTPIAKRRHESTLFQTTKVDVLPQKLGGIIEEADEDLEVDEAARIIAAVKEQISMKYLRISKLNSELEKFSEIRSQIVTAPVPAVDEEVEGVEEVEDCLDEARTSQATIKLQSGANTTREVQAEYGHNHKPRQYSQIMPIVDKKEEQPKAVNVDHDTFVEVDTKTQYPNSKRASIIEQDSNPPSLFEQDSVSSRTSVEDNDPEMIEELK